MKKEIVAVVVFWLCVVGVSLLWGLNKEKNEHKQLAFETARAFFQQVLVTREWNAEHGGVYVPVTEKVYPNLFLDDPSRDIVTDKGSKLTKINPAYMTRQLANIASRQKGIKFHITSLKPIRPQNKPNRWEKEWLETFDLGADEQGAFFTGEPGPSFRYMAPLLVEESCLQCHSKQGYEIGQVLGGISITIPYLAQKKSIGILIGSGVTGVVGIIIILWGGFVLNRKDPS